MGSLLSHLLCRGGRPVPLVMPTAVITRPDSLSGRDGLSEVRPPDVRADEGPRQLGIHIGVFVQGHRCATLLEAPY